MFRAEQECADLGTCVTNPRALGVRGRSTDSVPADCVGCKQAGPPTQRGPPADVQVFPSRRKTGVEAPECFKHAPPNGKAPSADVRKLKASSCGRLLKRVPRQILPGRARN